MRRLEVDGDSVRIEAALEASNHLATEALLDGKAAGIKPDDPGQLRDADDAVMGDVADPGLAEERQGMGLTGRKESNPAPDHLADPAVGGAGGLRWKIGVQPWGPLVN